MYEISCTECGRIGFHPSRVAAQSRAERHEADTDHGVSVGVMDGI
ncbi:hypothetical protein [Natronomonas marina]|jgi:hypothetical protein|nr:hypothetical protein [Natronomonas marina]